MKEKYTIVPYNSKDQKKADDMFYFLFECNMPVSEIKELGEYCGLFTIKFNSLNNSAEKKNSPKKKQ